MFRRFYLPPACVAMVASLVGASAQATPAAEECPAGYTLHPRLGLCVAEPTCPAGSAMHSRLHVCVRAPTCPQGSTWHPHLHRCVTP
jgi:hypothetical protein